jgi:hypothetical protein
MRWQEFANKMEIYNSVKRVERTLKLRATDASLAELLSRAETVNPFTKGWAFEGIGYFYASSRLAQGDGRSMLKSNAALNECPESRSMLHAGMGMALAEDLLKRLRSRSITTVDYGLDEFERRCELHAEAGFVGAALEPLGLMVRTYYRDLLLPIAKRLKQRSGPLLEYFWHGVGRAIYFALEYFPPCCGLTLERAIKEADDNTEVKNLVAGLSWAITLVNLRQPDVIEAVLQRNERGIPESEAFASGVTSSLLIAYDTAPHVDFMSLFCSHHSASSELSANCLPKQLIQIPCAVAYNLNRVGIGNYIHLGEVFRYQAPSWFNSRLSAAPR